MLIETIETSPYYSNFFRLGQRNYVQGSTLVQGLLEAIKQWNLGSLNQLKVSCHTMLNEQGCYELLCEDDPNAAQKTKQCATLFNVNCDGVAYFVILNGTQKEVTTSIPYDEASMVSTHQFDSNEKTIRIKWENQCELLKLLIALNKVLLNKLLPSEKHGKWIFYKCDLNWQSLHAANGILTLQLKGNLGLQSALSNIYLNDNLLGNIFFSRPVL
tara:strand:+ start:190 stop:834 length:645 start_codon:yes stop_codon:yes gene_type:complete